MSKRRPDRVSIASGIAVTLLGILLLLDQAGTLTLRFDYTAPAVLATVGVVLLTLGLARDRPDENAASSVALTTEDAATAAEDAR